MTSFDRSVPLLLVKLRTSDRSEFRIVTDQVLTFDYTDSDNKADKLVLTVDNRSLQNFDDPVWRKGSTLIVSWGYPGRMSPPREVVVTSVKGFTILQIEALAQSIKMNLVPRGTTYNNKKISEIAALIAARYGFGPTAQHIQDTEIVREHTAHGRLTDAQFLKKWARRLGFEFYVDFDGFHFHERNLGDRPIRTLVYRTDQGGGDFIGDPNVDNDVTAAPAKVKVKGRDPLEKTDLDASADNDSDRDRETLTEISEIVGEFDDNATTVREIGSTAVVDNVENATDATATAKAKFRRAQLMAIKMTADIIGDPLLAAKSVVKIDGMGQRLSVRYYLKEVKHSLGSGGYKSTLSLVSDGHGGHSTVSERAIGFGKYEPGRSGKGAGATTAVSEAVLKKFQTAIAIAERSGDAEAVTGLKGAATAYASKSATAAQLEPTIAEIARHAQTRQNPQLLQATTEIAASFRQAGAETANKGKPNRLESEDDSETLGEAIGEFDDQPSTVYLQNQRARR
jgi:hypothetical protein